MTLATNNTQRLRPPISALTVSPITKNTFCYIPQLFLAVCGLLYFSFALSACAGGFAESSSRNSSIGPHCHCWNYKILIGSVKILSHSWASRTLVMISIHLTLVIFQFGSFDSYVNLANLFPHWSAALPENQPRLFFSSSLLQAKVDNDLWRTLLALIGAHGSYQTAAGGWTDMHHLEGNVNSRRQSPRRGSPPVVPPAAVGMLSILSWYDVR